jgi:hypothetical protein
MTAFDEAWINGTKEGSRVPDNRAAPVHLATARGRRALNDDSMAQAVCGVMVSVRDGRVTCFRHDATCRYCLR